PARVVARVPERARERLEPLRLGRAGLRADRRDPEDDPDRRAPAEEADRVLMERDLSLYVVEPTDSLRTAMEKIEQNKHRVVVVVDEGRVLGTVSDGDIRRAYLHELLPIAPVSQIMQLNPHVTQE